MLQKKIDKLQKLFSQSANIPELRKIFLSLFAETIEGVFDGFSDESAYWINLEGKKHSVCINFDEWLNYESVQISEKTETVDFDEKIIITIG